MSELRERLREAAEAAAQEGRIPAAAAVVRRGRRRRVRLVGATVVLVVVAVFVIWKLYGYLKRSLAKLKRSPSPAGP